MKEKSPFAVVITSIFPPTEAVIEIAREREGNPFDFIVVGDSKSPDDYPVENCIYFPLDQQLKSEFSLGPICPTGHYARKNLGYLLSISRQCEYIVETDDDNIPLPDFWSKPQQRIQSTVCENQGWVNVYRHFTDALIWPRGLPLDAIHHPLAVVEQTGELLNCPIQQGLADENPDVDAIFRLVCSLPQSFQPDRQIALGKGSWCTFNSQNTIWFPDAFPLLYLPSFCSFRMTDIWRSLVAQRIGWENNWWLLFKSSTVYQKRNAHHLMKDFKDEVDGYLHNDAIAQALARLPLSSGIANIPDNMNRCYRELVDMGLINGSEMDLLQAWIHDLERFWQPSNPSS